MKGCQTAEWFIGAFHENSDIEVRAERLLQSFGADIGHPRQAAEDARAAHPGDDPLRLLVFLADKGNPEDRNVTMLHRLHGKQGVIDGAERGPRAEDRGDLPACENIGVNQIVGKRHQ